MLFSCRLDGVRYVFVMPAKEVLETSVSLIDRRERDDYLGLLGRLRPGHKDEVLVLTLLPREFTPSSRVLSLSTHYHREERLAHWSFRFEAPPSSVPPPEIRDLSERLGGVEGFVTNLQQLWGTGVSQARCIAAFLLNKREFPCSFLPVASRAPSGAKVTRTVTWSFEPPRSPSSVTLVVGPNGQDYIARIAVEHEMSPGTDMFASTEENAWNAFGQFLTRPRARRGTR